MTDGRSESPRLTVVGHLNLDVVARNVRALEEGSQDFSKGHVTAEVGGSITHLGQASRGLCRNRTAVCCIGHDGLGDILRLHVRDLYDEVVLFEKTAESTCIVPIIYRAEGAREIIAPLVSANDLLTQDDLEDSAARAALETADLVIVDGYTAVETNGRNACAKALMLANKGGAMSFLDVVPHHAYQLYGVDELADLAEAADVIIIEMRTLRGFLGRPRAARPDSLVHDFRALFPGKVGILRYGRANIELNRIVSRTNDLVYDGSEEQDDWGRPGYGDRLTLAQALALWSSRQQKDDPADGIRWLEKISSVTWGGSG